jgi:hypothetical protein
MITTVIMMALVMALITAFNSSIELYNRELLHLTARLITMPLSK